MVKTGSAGFAGLGGAGVVPPNQEGWQCHALRRCRTVAADLRDRIDWGMVHQLTEPEDFAQWRPNVAAKPAAHTQPIFQPQRAGEKQTERIVRWRLGSPNLS